MLKAKIDFPTLLIDHLRIIIEANKTYWYNVTKKKNVGACIYISLSLLNSKILPDDINFVAKLRVNHEILPREFIFLSLSLSPQNLPFARDTLWHFNRRWRRIPADYFRTASNLNTNLHHHDLWFIRIDQIIPSMNYTFSHSSIQGVCVQLWNSILIISRICITTLSSIVKSSR